MVSGNMLPSSEAKAIWIVLVPVAVQRVGVWFHLECSVFSQVNKLRSQQVIYLMEIYGLLAVCQALARPVASSVVTSTRSKSPGRGQRHVTEQAVTERRDPGCVGPSGYQFGLGAQAPCRGLSSTLPLIGYLI